MNLQADIKKGLLDLFRFKKVSGEWLQEGQCPDCGKFEAFCAADEPKIVRCGRQDRCGWEDSVRNLLPDLFEDWSKRHPITEQDPHAAADAYLQHERGLDMRYLRGAYTQELYRDQETGQTGATIRFPIGNTHWERIIDRPGRFGKKAHFRAGGTYKGHCWVSPPTTMDMLAKAKEIVFAEGIFDAVALCMVGHLAASTMSTNNWPGLFLSQLRAALEAIGRTDRPKLTFAYDVGAAGVKWTKRHVRQARAEGWDAGAMQVRPDGEGTKLDWNDLLLRHLDWDDDEDKAPLGPEAFETYRYNGEITIAANHYEKAKLIAARRVSQAKAGGFHFRHANSMYWGKINYGEESADKGLSGKVSSEEICNCAFRLLYRERDEIIDETTYFLQLDFADQETVKARFSSAACASSGEFKKRMLDFAGSWSGTGEQLDKIIRVQTRRNGDISLDDARAQIATITAIGADWHWIITGEGEPAPASTLAARRALLDQAIITIAAIAREREGFSPELEEQGHLVIAMHWHLEPERQTHNHARFNHESRRLAQPPEQARAA